MSRSCLWGVQPGRRLVFRALLFFPLLLFSFLLPGFFRLYRCWLITGAFSSCQQRAAAVELLPASHPPRHRRYTASSPHSSVSLFLLSRSEQRKEVEGRARVQMCINEAVKGRGWLIHREREREGKKSERLFACRDNEIHHFYNAFLSLSLYLCRLLSPSKSSSHHPAFSHFFSSLSLSPSLSLSLLYLLPLSFALRLAATADLNNSAQAGILQGPIVCAWQENEKERDREGEREKREREDCRAARECVCVSV